MDETKQEQDSSLNEDTSGGSEGTTSKAEIKTFTEEEVQKLINDSLAAKGRDAKRLTEWESNLKSQEEANKTAAIEIERQRLEAQRKELESVADDPEAKKALLRSFDLEKKEREIKENAERQKEAIQKMFNDAVALAAEYKLNPSDLLSAGSPEEMKLLAKNLALQRDLDSVKQAKEKPPTEETTGFPRPDSATSDAGADSDEAFLTRWNAGDLPATKENIARAQKIVNK